MNKPNGGQSFVNRVEKYNIPTDEDGNSLLTGEGANCDWKFTCVELEVYEITY